MKIFDNKDKAASKEGKTISLRLSRAVERVITKEIKYDQKYVVNIPRESLKYAFLEDIQAFVCQHNRDGLNIVIIDQMDEKTRDVKKTIQITLTPKETSFKELDKAFRAVVGNLPNMGLETRTFCNILNQYDAYLHSTGLDAICSNQSKSNQLSYVVPTRHHAF